MMYAMVDDKLKDMGLTLAEKKTEIIWIPRKKESMEGINIKLNDCASICVNKSMKYLGVHLDSRLSFKEHVNIRAEKTINIINGLYGILHNTKGPKEKKRKLYVNAVQSSILYGCPHWLDSCLADPRVLKPFHRINRIMALRVVSAYRTVSRVAAELLAGMIPIDLLAQAYAEAYFESNRRVGVVPKERKKMILNERKTAAREKWKRVIQNTKLPGRRVREAILPIFDKWMDREFGQLDYYTTQIITGHGSFRDYLYKYNKIEDNICLQCKRTADTAQHTLEECSGWQVERRKLQEEIGPDLALKSVLARILESASAWTAFKTFCESVLKKKEEFVRGLITAGEIIK